MLFFKKKFECCNHNDFLAFRLSKITLFGSHKMWLTTFNLLVDKSKLAS